MAALCFWRAWGYALVNNHKRIKELARMTRPYKYLAPRHV